MSKVEADGQHGPKEVTYFLTRILFLRSLSLVYFVAFLVAYNQNEGLLGDDGLLPANVFFERLKGAVGSNATKFEAFAKFPTLLWFLDNDGSHVLYYLQKFALAGMTLSGLVFFHGSSNSFVMAAMWILYFSIDTLGQRWYSFGWETQLLETGFISIFMVPTLSFSKSSEVPRVAIYACWWLIFRIMTGAGLIKIRGDQCWRDLTCMDYHYETQPVPNPVSFYLHHNNKVFHRVETLVNHIIELFTPWFMFLGRKYRVFNGICQIIFQLVLIVSGNLSFLNWLTILPSITYLDDSFLVQFGFLWSSSDQNMVANERGDELFDRSWWAKVGRVLRRVKSLLFGVLIAYLSIPVVRNLLALDGHQAMNTSFGSFKLVNTYGAFGSITKKRMEVVLQGTLDDIRKHGDVSKAVWKEYEFKCKPGDVKRRPCVISPYHYRLDWLMWFAAFGNYQQHPWLMHLTAKLLSKHDYSHVKDLMAKIPFNSTQPPKFIRAEHYEYIFSKPAKPNGAWWTRTRKGEYFPPVSLDHQSFQEFGKHYGFAFPNQ
jgi:hypothetical protein